MFFSMLLIWVFTWVSYEWLQTEDEKLLNLGKQKAEAGLWSEAVDFYGRAIEFLSSSYRHKKTMSEFNGKFHFFYR